MVLARLRALTQVMKMKNFYPSIAVEMVLARLRALTHMF